jgi:hypothetical protein
VQELILTRGEPAFRIERPAIIVIAIGIEPKHPARISRTKPKGVFSGQQRFSIPTEASHLRGALTVHPADEANAIGGQFGMEFPKFMGSVHETENKARLGLEMGPAWRLKEIPFLLFCYPSTLSSNLSPRGSGCYWFARRLASLVYFVSASAARCRPQSDSAG